MHRWQKGDGGGLFQERCARAGAAATIAAGQDVVIDGDHYLLLNHPSLQANLHVHMTKSLRSLLALAHFCRNTLFLGGGGVTLGI